ncbi:putative quinol monooxygenase [Nocardia goodfellowii]|uniref:Quinol monooxygenase YgiN n=1 Tax=Nocardia goodfellowii TaxID=882446 RepID=A0ABS4QB34_9NOCA|nr:putative quinol monooxygenase [Nocardia goodfellowii]MBP2188877.1 quinol monooxygenase YgiN [Nocardia goodfellowii]
MSTLSLNVRFTAKPGQETALRTILQNMIEPTVAEEGCLAYELYLHPTDPSRVVLLEEWVDAAALAAHFQTPHLKQCIADLEPVLAEPLRMRQFHDAVPGDLPGLS